MQTLSNHTSESDLDNSDNTDDDQKVEYESKEKTYDGIKEFTWRAS